MLVMVLAGTFHKTYERGLLGNVPQNNKHKLTKTRYIADISLSLRVQINTEFDYLRIDLYS